MLREGAQAQAHTRTKHTEGVAREGRVKINAILNIRKNNATTHLETC